MILTAWKSISPKAVLLESMVVISCKSSCIGSIDNQCSHGNVLASVWNGRIGSTHSIGIFPVGFQRRKLFQWEGDTPAERHVVA